MASNHKAVCLLPKLCLSSFVVLAVVVVLALQVSKGCSGRQRSRAEVYVLVESINPGSRIHDIVNLPKDKALHSIKARIISSDRILFTTPYEFGAGNWVVYIDFSNSVVRSVKVRTADSPDEKPKNAPLDRRF